MSGAARGIENAEVARVLPRTYLDGFICGAYEVFADLVESRLVAVHLQPETSKRIVREELNNIAWCEELVAHSHFAAVARRLRSALIRVTHRLALFPRIEELINPADRL